MTSAIRQHALAAALALLLTGCGSAPPIRLAGWPPAAPACAVYFSPRGGCTEAITSRLAGAEHSILVEAYAFTSDLIAEALIQAQRRGVYVAVILDKTQRDSRQSVAPALADAGMPVRIDEAHAIAHSKVMVIDGRTVITGSFNFTQAAESRNAENLLILDDPSIAGRYAANWREHWSHAEPLAPAGAARTPP